MKLLIVEDNSQMRQMIRAVVSDLAEAVVECADGEEAVAAYAAQRLGEHDRVLMDLQMPRVGGLEATRRIRAAFPDAQIIIVTQHDDPHWRTAATQAGACGYVLKENLLDVRGLLSQPLALETRNQLPATAAAWRQLFSDRRDGDEEQNTNSEIESGARRASAARARHHLRRGRRAC